MVILVLRAFLELVKAGTCIYKVALLAKYVIWASFSLDERKFIIFKMILKLFTNLWGLFRRSLICEMMIVLFLINQRVFTHIFLISKGKFEQNFLYFMLILAIVTISLIVLKFFCCISFFEIVIFFILG